MTAAPRRSQPEAATHYRDAWRSAIYDATGDYVKTQRAMKLAELNGLFDPIDALATPEEASTAATVSEFKNELSNTIRITIEGPTSTSTNDLTPLETAKLNEVLTSHFRGRSEASTAAGEAVALARENNWRTLEGRKLAAPPAAQTDGVRDDLITALQFIVDGYDNHDVNHVDYRVKVYRVALDALAAASLSPQVTEAVRQ